MFRNGWWGHKNCIYLTCLSFQCTSERCWWKVEVRPEIIFSDLIFHSIYWRRSFLLHWRCIPSQGTIRRSLLFVLFPVIGLTEHSVFHASTAFIWECEYIPWQKNEFACLAQVEELLQEFGCIFKFYGYGLLPIIGRRVQVLTYCKTHLKYCNFSVQMQCRFTFTCRAYF